MTVLLDANLLIALHDEDHVHHDVAEEWSGGVGPMATCPITQGAVVRHLLRRGRTVADAARALDSLTGSGRYEFWPDDLPYAAVDLAGIVGHRQVTDAYLAGLARVRSGRLATLDRGLAALHADVAVLIDQP